MTDDWPVTGRVELLLESGPDPEHPGRFYVRARWDNPRGKYGPTHESLSLINEASVEKAIIGLLLDDRFCYGLIEADAASIAISESISVVVRHD